MVMGPTDSDRVAQRAQGVLDSIESEYLRPSVVFKAKLRKSSGVWCAYIDGTQYSGGLSNADFFAIGETPDEAMCNFDKKWREKEASNDT